MPKSWSLEDILAMAKKKEKKNSWEKATDSYKQALSVVDKDKIPRKGEIQERIGYCLLRAAFQAETREEFRKLMKMAIKAYNKAAEQYEKEEKQGCSDHCKASAMRVKSWTASNYVEEKALLDGCIKLWKKVAMDYEETEDRCGYGKVCNELLDCLLDRFEIEQNWLNRREILKEGLNYGEKAIENNHELGNNYKLTRAYYLTGLLYSWTAHYGKLEKRKKLGEKSRTYFEKALELAEEIGDPYLIAMSNYGVLHNLYWISGDLKISREKAEKVLQLGIKIKDNLLIQQAFYWLASITHWRPWTEENPDRKRELFEIALKYANQATVYSNKISSYAFTGETHWLFIEIPALIAREVETNREKKRLLLERSIKTGRKAVESTDQLGHPEYAAYRTKSLSKALYFLSSIEMDNSRKESLLKEALRHAKNTVEIAEKAFPFWYWYRGVGYNYQAMIMAELAKIETGEDKKRQLLEKAVSNMERCIKFCTRWTEYNPQVELIAILGRYHDWFGAILKQLHQLTGKAKTLQRMIKVYRGAVRAYEEVDMPSRLAETYWELAKVRNRLGEYLDAAENFEFASLRYEASAKKIPHLKDFYIDFASYMKAWSEIEKGRYHHTRQEYGQARKHYEKVATLHKSSESWKDFAPNYLAWTKMEDGEDLSRTEQSQKAIEAFKKAAELFHETRKSLLVELDKFENTGEKDLAEKLIKASKTRREYCQGRIILEEAKILHRQGDHTASLRKYGSATRKFQEITEKTRQEIDRQELEAIVFLCQAWQMMIEAEVKTSPDLYLEASQLFDEAKEHSFHEKARLMASGHSLFCKALEAGTRFETTRDTALYLATTKHLEGAANYYVRAGFKTASEHAKATQRLFDAYIYMDNANAEIDPEKKARYYIMAEKVLETSAGSYLKAKHPQKSQQVQRLLEKVKGERELAMSLSEVLHAPTITSSTTSFGTLAPDEENAVGLERFEHANVQTTLIHQEKEARVGEDFKMKIQVANVGKEPVLLTKVEEILPTGFQLVTKPNYCNFENMHLDMKGKRVDPLKTEEIPLVLRSFSKGTSEMKPRIIYVDENGHQMTSKPKPVKIHVSEVILPGRITTGYAALDKLMFGGIPQGYSVILTSPSCDERDLLIKNFLEAGLKKGEVTFHITARAKTSGLINIVERYPSSFYLFVCNPQVDKMIEGTLNVFKLKGVENLTDINISLTSTIRKLNKPQKGQRRICIENISDVLLQHRTVQTRRWLNAIIPDLKSRGFTTLAVIDSDIHPRREIRAIVGVFDGEINIYQKETERGSEKLLKIKKMSNQRYSKSELVLQ